MSGPGGDVHGPGGGTWSWGVPGPGGGGIPAFTEADPPPREQNDKQVQKYYLAPNFVCGR